MELFYKLLRVISLWLVFVGFAHAAITTPLDMTTACGGSACVCTANASCSVTTPTGIALNDLIVADLSFPGGTPVTPSGWNVFVQDPIDGGNNGWTWGKSYWKCASGSEAGTEGPFGVGGGNMSVAIQVYRGTTCPSSPVDQTTDSSHGGATSVPANSLPNTSVANEWVLHLFFNNKLASPPTWTKPAGDTLDIQQDATATFDGNLISHLALGGAGSAVTGVTATQSVTDNYVGLSATIKPFAASGSVLGIQALGCGNVNQPCIYPWTTIAQLPVYLCAAGQTCSSGITDATANCPTIYGTLPVTGGGQTRCPAVYDQNQNKWIIN